MWKIWTKPSSWGAQGTSVTVDYNTWTNFISSHDVVVVHHKSDVSKLMWSVKYKLTCAGGGGPPTTGPTASCRAGAGSAGAWQQMTHIQHTYCMSRLFFTRTCLVAVVRNAARWNKHLTAYGNDHIRVVLESCTLSQFWLNSYSVERVSLKIGSRAPSRITDWHWSPS